MVDVRRLLRLTILFPGIVIAAHAACRVALADCQLTSTGIVTLNDLGTEKYNGVAGGLYPNSANNPPSTHLNAGIALAKKQIRPLNRLGSVDPANGKIVFISVGMSNTTQEFSIFVRLANSDRAKNPQLVIVDGAQGGQDASRWTDPNAATWATVNSRLNTAGVTPAQVQVAWLGWASYLWADGTNPRSDGFTWLCSDVQSDFTHPSTSGRNKVAHELLAFFKTHATATPWFLRHTVTGQPPTCSVTASTTNGLAPLKVNFSATANDPDGTIVQYAWTFDDGDFSFARNPVKNFPAPGVYNVRLTVSDDSGNTVTKTLTVTVTTPN
jgi:PKD domain